LFVLWRSTSIQNFMVPCWLVQVLHPPQTFERPPFWNGWRYGIKKYSVEVTFNGMTSLLNYIKIYQFVQKLLGGTHRQTDRLVISKPHFPFKELRLRTSRRVRIKISFFKYKDVYKLSRCYKCHKKFIYFSGINPLKPNGKYMSHLLQQSITAFCFCGFHVILTVHSDYFLKQR
jgi:hypothetical protein